MSFAHLNLNPLVFKALEACGYQQPTEVQSRSIPDILQGKDLIASAQTGTGKTAAFVLPTLHQLTLSKPNPKPRALILTPTRELADQIMNAATKYGKFLNLKVISLIGGMPYHPQLKKLARSVDIIVATPGRLMDHMENKKVDLSQVEILILDEADRMFDMGFIDDVKHIASKTSSKRQTLLFSATFNERLSKTTAGLLKNPVRIDLSEKNIAPTQIKNELYYADSSQHKNKLFFHLLNNEKIYKAIIFSSTKVQADRMAKQMQDQGFAAAALHGDMKQNARTRTVSQLRDNRIQFLVATDVAARGIDISDISHVINYDLPKSSEDFVHRIGRTGRAGKSGHAISLAVPSEMRQIQSIERLMKHKFLLETIPGLEPQKLPVNQPSSTKKSRPSRGAPHKKKGSQFQSREGGRGERNKTKPRFAREDSRDHREGSHGERSKSKPRFAREDSRDQREGGRGERSKSKPRFAREDSRDHHEGGRSERNKGKPRFAREDSRDHREGGRSERNQSKPRFAREDSRDYRKKAKGSDHHESNRDDRSKSNSPTKKRFGESKSRFARSHESEYSPKKTETYESKPKHEKKARFARSEGDSRFEPKASRGRSTERTAKRNQTSDRDYSYSSTSKPKKKTASSRPFEKSSEFKKTKGARPFTKGKPVVKKRRPADR
jgi:superfamily II DNA/RNA helicase